MRVNPLPPQAYTKETLQKAYSWLLTQNSSVKEMAQDQNILVSLYLKAQRNGDASLETPSIQNFKQELKSLANLMGDFQTGTAGGSANVSLPQMTVQSSPQQMPTMTAPSANPMTSVAAAATTSPSVNPAQTFAQNTQAHVDLAMILDAKTMSALNDVREALNLSSDAEAIRALVALGIKQFKKFGI